MSTWNNKNKCKICGILISDEATTCILHRPVRAKPVEIEGVQYESMGAAIKALGVPHPILTYRIRSKSKKFANWKFIE